MTGMTGLTCHLYYPKNKKKKEGSLFFFFFFKRQTFKKPVIPVIPVIFNLLYKYIYKLLLLYHKYLLNVIKSEFY